MPLDFETKMFRIISHNCGPKYDGECSKNINLVFGLTFKKRQDEISLKNRILEGVNKYLKENSGQIRDSNLKIVKIKCT